MALHSRGNPSTDLQDAIMGGRGIDPSLLLVGVLHTKLGGIWKHLVSIGGNPALQTYLRSPALKW